MTETLLATINQYVCLDSQMQADLTKYLIPKKIPMGDWLLQEGQVFSFILFIEIGSVYYYKIDEQGKERVVNFIFEGDVFTDIESYVAETASDFYIKALEPSVIYLLEKQHLEKLLETDLRWERLMRLIMQDAFIRSINERKSMRTLSNTEYYIKLTETYPTLLQQVPLYLIASYLNITPEGLSKIRRRISQK